MTNCTKYLIVLFLTVGKMSFGADFKNQASHLPTTFSVKGRDEKLKCDDKLSDKSNDLFEILDVDRRMVLQNLREEISKPTISKYVRNAIINEDDVRYYEIFQSIQKSTELNRKDFIKYLLAYENSHNYELSWIENFNQKNYRPDDVRPFGLINAIAFSEEKNLYIYRPTSSSNVLQLCHRFVVDGFNQNIKILAYSDGTYRKLIPVDLEINDTDDRRIIKAQEQSTCINKLVISNKSIKVPQKAESHFNNTNSAIRTEHTSTGNADSLSKCDRLIDQGHEQKDIQKNKEALKKAETLIEECHFNKTDAVMSTEHTSTGNADLFLECDRLIDQGHKQKNIEIIKEALKKAETLDAKFNPKRYFEIFARIHLAWGKQLYLKNRSVDAEAEYQKALTFSNLSYNLLLIAKSNFGIGSNCQGDPAPYLEEVIRISERINRPLLKVEAFLAYGHNKGLSWDKKREYAKEALLETNFILKNNPDKSAVFQDRIKEHKRKARCMLLFIDTNRDDLNNGHEKKRKHDNSIETNSHKNNNKRRDSNSHRDNIGISVFVNVGNNRQSTATNQEIDHDIYRPAYGSTFRNQ